MSNQKKPLLIIISAPSGSGKTTIINRLMEETPGLARTVTYTTRPPREGEVDNQDYVFVSREEFNKKAENGEFLEWEENFGNHYGTPRSRVEEAIANCEDLVLSIDVKGTRRVKKAYPESVSVFIMPPSEGALEERLKKRNTDQSEQVSLRLKESQKEIAAADEYDYLIVNEDLEKAVEELKAVIETERDIRKKQTEQRVEGREK